MGILMADVSSQFDCKNNHENSLVLKKHWKREDMTTFILDYTKKELHYSVKCYTFLISM